MQELKQRMKICIEELDFLYSKLEGREGALARTNLEQSEMWAQRALELKEKGEINEQK